MVRKNPPDRGRGVYQKGQDSLTKLKVLHYLTAKPYPYQSLWADTRIQRNKLRKVLDNFVETGVLISHSYKWKTDYLGTNKNCDAKTALSYYVLNLDSKEALRWLRNIPLDTYVKDIYRCGKFEEYIQFLKKKAKITKLKGSLTSNFAERTFIEDLKIVKKMDYLFLPWLYLPEDEKPNYNKQYFEISFVEDFMDVSKILPPFQEFFDNSKFLYDPNSEFQQFPDQNVYRMTVRSVLKVCKKYDLSKYDILIHLSYLDPTRENYLFLWNALKEY